MIELQRKRMRIPLALAFAGLLAFSSIAAVAADDNQNPSVKPPAQFMSRCRAGRSAWPCRTMEIGSLSRSSAP